MCKPCLFLTCILAFVANSIFAQQQAVSSWSGKLTGSSGDALTGAVVQLNSGAVVRNSKTNSDGTFRFESLPAGHYRLSVEWHGRRISYPLAIDIPGSSAANVLILSAQGALSISSPEAQAARSGGEQLSSQAVSSIPLNKRDFSQLLLLAA